MIACLVTTYNRPDALARSLPQIVKLGSPVLVVDDGSRDWCQNQALCASNLAYYLRLPENRGLAAAMNAGLAYWLADKSIEWVSYFQDDVDVHPRCLEILARFQKSAQILSGHDAKEHAFQESGKKGDISFGYKRSIRATHIHARCDFWESVMPIPTRSLGAPKHNGEGRGIGSNVDWWICRDAPQSCQKSKRSVICVPGLVRSFLWKAEDSCWNNMQTVGEDAALRAI